MSHPSEPLVCGACGDSKISRMELGIDNRPLGVCKRCFPGRRKHYPLTPLIAQSKWKPPAKHGEAPSVGAFD